jgi:L-lactate dehydrogenase complex protein LldE
MLLRPSPQNKPVSLFATCMVDMVYPNVGIATVTLLDHIGVDVNFPMGQTCCGQPAFNAGFWDDARPVARQFLKTFAEADVIVTPSGSCASMVQHYYPQLFADDPKWHPMALRAASITWELTEYLVDGLGIVDFGASLPPTRVAMHHACHGLRLSGLKSQARQLAASIDGVTLVDMADADTCCGFGGLFAVKMADVSGAMLKEKVEAVTQVPADVVITGDCGCMAQINGGLSRGQHAQRVMHIADLIVSGM